MNIGPTLAAEAEAIIAAGCVGHNQLRFYPAAMQLALELSDHDEAERYAAALEEFTRAEPLPWSDFFVARGRALAAASRGRRDAALTAQLERLRDEGERLGLRGCDLWTFRDDEIVCKNSFWKIVER